MKVLGGDRDAGAGQVGLGGASTAPQVPSCPCYWRLAPRWGRDPHGVHVSATRNITLWFCPTFQNNNVPSVAVSPPEDGRYRGGCKWVHKAGACGGARPGSIQPGLNAAGPGRRGALGHGMMKMEALGATAVLAGVLAAYGRGGWAPHPSTGRGDQGAPLLQAQGTSWCWRSMTTRRCTLGT